ncbi:MAG: MgtC/SapB family protein [Armatimonadota bacterium]|nr:MgtC/SapB family protein [Armatimonadota bacterium]
METMRLQDIWHTTQLGHSSYVFIAGEQIHFDDILQMIARLVLSGLLGALIGYERETHGRPAGLRTHMLVCMGSTIFTIVSSAFVGAPDPSRVASQIVSGIGFLGAGTIIRQGSIVRGLTTAASLWTIAAIGMAVGVSWNLAIFAVVAALVVFVTLGVLNKIEHSLISRRRYRELGVIMREGAQDISSVLNAISAHGIEIQGVRSEDTVEAGRKLYKLRLRLPPGMRPQPITDMLAGMPGIISFDWE